MIRFQIWFLTHAWFEKNRPAVSWFDNLKRTRLFGHQVKVTYLTTAKRFALLTSFIPKL